ncbi:hypothetical protein [Pedobacter nanyangensis]|uniref:hypothetical protein n=1 Tax=Pedobacter nanyangensis TaxID=1562389 RepID=UPI000DE241C9|nr:hypothetical protein [Pedobacter nanyangensis]
MRTYCLTYDAVDSEKYKKDPNYFREKIVNALKGLECENFHMPVATTIIFDHPFSDIDSLSLRFRIAMNSEIYFFLCLIGQSEKRPFLNQWINQKLSDEFDEFVSNT